MRNLNKELLLNLFAGSPILTAIWAVASTRVEDSSPMDMGAFLPAMLVILTLYPFYVCISLLHFGLGLWIRSLALRLGAINALGLLLAAAAGSYVLVAFWPVYSCFCLFSVISLIGLFRSDVD